VLEGGTVSWLFRVLDIETIPDEDVWSPGPPSYKMVPRLESGPLSMLGQVAFETVEAFPPPQAHRVVAISYVDVVFDPTTEPRYRFDRCYTECRWATGAEGADLEEAKLLRAFSSAMDLDSNPNIHLVTWNGRGFDLPVLSMRSLKHKIPCGWYYREKAVRYRYSAEGHCDLMDFLSDFGAARQMKLDDFCHLIGLPGKTDMSGDKVLDQYRATVRDPELTSEIQAKVARYCLQDTVQTALSFLRTRHHFGKIDAASHDASLATFRESPSVCEALDIDWSKLVLS
jgi:3'-5' exonuclease